jgi:5-methylcytosine-specific restriction protein A
MPTIKLFKSRRKEPTVNKKAYQAVYNTPRWKKLRALKVQDAPICEECLKKGKVTPTEEVHHIIPFEIDNDISLAYDFDNLISLCVECHKEAHMKLKGGRFSPNYVNEKIEYRSVR